MTTPFTTSSRVAYNRTLLQQRDEAPAKSVDLAKWENSSSDMESVNHTNLVMVSDLR